MRTLKYTCGDADGCVSQVCERFRLYALERDCCPCKVLILDRRKFHGGSMCGYILWVDRRLSAWRRATGYPEKLPIVDHAAVDRWIRGHIPTF